MKKTLLIYRSKTGFTQQYAKWLQDAFPCDLVPYSKRNQVKLSDYDILIFGSSFHGGQIARIKWFKAQSASADVLQRIVFATGATPDDAPAVETAIAQNFTPQEREETPVFYLQSGINYEAMGPASRAMMSLFRRMLKKAEGENSQAYQMISHSYDSSSREKLDPLLTCLRSLKSGVPSSKV